MSNIDNAKVEAIISEYNTDPYLLDVPAEMDDYLLKLSDEVLKGSEQEVIDYTAKR